MIVLFTDFGMNGPYVGQVKAVLYREAPLVKVIDLFADAPVHNPQASAYLLAAYVKEFPPGTVFLCVVDPGVGGERLPMILNADGRWFVGPENGLFELVIRRNRETPRWWHITWRPEKLSASFHGRDLFAPIAARIAHDYTPTGEELPIDEIRRKSWPDDLAEIIYVDVFGNAMTGIRAEVVSESTTLIVAGQHLKYAKTFSSIPKMGLFWYDNANGLVEVAANQGRAVDILGVKPGDTVKFAPPRPRINI
ncbi:MAG: SAM-dependent chlorinase/fluorinase [Rhodospirillales bacterium]|nr:SAM-dependent chlorinase/fluorinase [Rhodospirillales bacterium]